MDQRRTCKHVKLTEKLRGKISWDLRAQWKVLRRDAKSTVCERRAARPAVTEIKRFWAMKQTIQREKKQTTVSVACTWQSIYLTKDLLSGIYKEFSKRSHRQAIDPVRKWAKTRNWHFTQEDTQVTNGFMKKTRGTVSHWGNKGKPQRGVAFVIWSLSRVQLFVTPWTVAWLLGPQDFPGKNTGVCSHFLLQQILPTQDPARVSCIDFLPSVPPGKPTVRYYYLPIRTVKMKNSHKVFPGGPVVEELSSHAGDSGSIPGLGTKIIHATV